MPRRCSPYTNGAFAVSGRSITKSTSADTYNSTYAATGPFSGFKPFIGTGAPDVMWTEGSAEMVLADTTAGQSSTALSTSLLAIAALTPTSGPLMADQHGHQRGLQRRVPCVAVGRRGRVAHPGVGAPDAVPGTVLTGEHFVGERERHFQALAHRRLQHELAGRVGPPPRGPSPSTVSAIVSAKWLASLAPPRGTPVIVRPSRCEARAMRSCVTAVESIPGHLRSMRASRVTPSRSALTASTTASNAARPWARRSKIAPRRRARR